MRSAARLLSVSAALLAAVIVGRAQERRDPTPPPDAPTHAIHANDPRAGLKPGFRDAGEAIRNMEKIASMPKPEGFFDPKSPAGNPAPAQRPAGGGAAAEAAGGAAPVAGTAVTAGEPPAAGAPPTAAGETPAAPQAGGRPPGNPNQLSFTNSDLAFKGGHLFQGNYHGFNTYAIDSARKPKLVASVVCPGGQGDVSVHGNLLVMSVEQTRGRLDCGVGGVQLPVSAERFRGVRIFDISDVRKPKQVAAIQTCRGSHTHTLVNDPDDRENLYIYGSGTGAVRSAEELKDCSGKGQEDPNTSLFSIDVIKVPLAAPDKAAIVNRPRIFADPDTGKLGGLWQGGSHGPNTQTSRMTNQCHDITVYPEIGLAAGACSGNGILMDISDPVNPVRLDHVVDKGFAYWHSATFNNDGTKVVFTDEWGGGSRPRCRTIDPLTWGADAIFDVVDRKLVFRGYYKMPAPQTDQENCVAHNGSLIPVPGRDIMVQAWYQGGLSVFDFTDSANPVEIAYFDRGPINGERLVSGGYWSTYWYNGHVYGSEISRGVDVFRLLPSEHLTQNEIDAAMLIRPRELNTQQQTKISWPASTVVALAYVDQLTRSRSIDAERARTVKATLERADKVSPRDRSAGTVADQLDALAAGFERDAAASGRDADRMKALATTIKARTARLRS